ncbi:hypothetical protein E7V67_014990 [[Empedobacter] haloabium]|uniref:Uncharacterized protein n=1 Tax=[Empedobacter] haloabium TaxID=592317 RepID=A0ABZ1UG40_9BURK
MNLQLIKLTCASCLGVFEAPDLLSGAYGEFLLRSEGTLEVAYLNALEDAAYGEVYDLIKQNPRMHGMREHFIADVLRQIYAVVACDPDSAGYSFGIGQFPRCPFCSAGNVAHWEEIDPPIFIDLPADPVTHTCWDDLSKDQKIAKIDNELWAIGYI